MTEFLQNKEMTDEQKAEMIFRNINAHYNIEGNCITQHLDAELHESETINGPRLHHLVDQILSEGIEEFET